MPRKLASMEDTFLEMILASPDDEDPRLVFADWLEEQGNPRGEFIRLQCQRAKLTRYDPEWQPLLAREAVLFREYEGQWSKPFLRHVEYAGFRRGFVEHVQVSASKLLKAGDRLFRAAPIRSVKIIHADRLAEIAASPWLSRIVELDLSGNLLGGKSLQALLRSKYCQLRTLRLDECGLYPAVVQALASASSLTTLSSLSLAHNDVGEEGLRSLAEAENLKGLRELSLVRNQITSSGVRILTNHPVFRLTSLALSSNRIGNEGAAAIAACDRFADLRRLDLHSNEIGNAGLKALVESPNLHQIEHLGLNANHITSRGVQILTESAMLGNLRSIDLRTNEIDKATKETIPQRLKTPKLRELLF